MFGIKDFSSYYKTAIFVIMAILMIFFIGKIADIAIMFFVAFIISASILPLIDKLKKYMPRALAVSLILFLIFAGVLLIIVPLGMLAVKRFVSFTNQLPVYFEQFNTFYHSKGFQDSWARYFDLSTIENLGQYLNTFGGEILNQSLSVGKFIANSITSILMVTIMVFYICIDEAHMKKVYLTFFPPKFKEKASNILDILTTKVGGYVFAQILTMASVGILTFIGLLIAHHPQAPLIAFLTFILDIVPVFGATLAVILGVLTAFGGGVGYMLLILAIMGVMQWIESQLLRPYLFGKFMDIHPLLIIISLLIGAKFLGVSGVILGPAFASLVCVLVNELYIKQINSSGKQ